MRAKVVQLKCCNCEKVVFTGAEFEYEYPAGSGNKKLDVDGSYIDGAGECYSCGKIYCRECGRLLNNVCKNCRKEGE